MAQATRVPTVYFVMADIHDGSPFDALYGNDHIAFSTREEAEAQAYRLTHSRCWGADGNSTAAEVGVIYTVDEWAVDELLDDDGNVSAPRNVEAWAENARQRGLI